MRRSLAALAAVVAFAALAAPSAARAHTTSTNTTGPAGAIKHVVVIFQENRSFDEVLGAFCVDHANRCDGYVGPVKLADGTTLPMVQSPDLVTPDPPHNVKTQVKVIDHGRMDGWNGLPYCVQ